MKGVRSMFTTAPYKSLSHSIALFNYDRCLDSVHLLARRFFHDKDRVIIKLATDARRPHSAVISDVLAFSRGGQMLQDMSFRRVGVVLEEKWT
jgi:hypothetical protein